MPIELAPSETPRATSFECWKCSPMPMVTFFKTFNVTALIKFSKRSGIKFNTLICYCIGKAASQIKEFYLVPTNTHFIQYDKIAVGIVVPTKAGHISFCHLPFSNNLAEFQKNYLQLTAEVFEKCEPHNLQRDYMTIGTSAMTKCELDGVVNLYTPEFTTPFLAWGKYRKGFFKTTLPISLQFHHTQMDGEHACHFFNLLQDEMNNIARAPYSK